MNVSEAQRYLGELKQLRKSSSRTAVCLMSHVDGCGNLAISSHSLSKAALKLISKDSHVITASPKYNATKLETTADFLPKGIRRASTFKGFCEYHDNRLFLGIDQTNFRINEENVTSVFKRAVAQEAFKKYQLSNHNKILAKKFPDNTYMNSAEYKSGYEVAKNLLRKQLIQLANPTTDVPLAL